MTIQEYLKSINKRFKLGISTEHTFRGDLQNLLETIEPSIIATNEAKRIACGAPDYIITKKAIPIGYIEAKDIGDSDIYGKKANKEQFDRYKKSLNNLIITDYLDFYLYLDGKLVTSIKIADIKNGKIIPINDSFESFTDIIKEFCTYVGQTIKSASKLSKMMASKAKMLESVIEQAVTSDEHNEADSTLKDQMKAFKEVLIHDIKPSEFADIYAQTIAYGMFAGRLHDPTKKDFSRKEAAELIPKSNPFLRKLFQHIAGIDLDNRISWIVDALADVFRATDPEELKKDFGSATQQNDPMIHFYETFLAEYNPKLRKSRGVYYTPEPVVNFIVRAVDDILKSEFGLSKGLADTSTTTVKVDTQTPDKKSQSGYKQVKQKVHKVQILDPAVGTGTFLTEIIKHIYKGFEGQQGIWSKYVEDHLIPRLNGFEILMASYSMAHLKLELLLQQTGYKPKKQQRLQVYLTNSLEQHHPTMETWFANWLSKEANEANHIKRDVPVMVVLGNPPYSGISINKGKWITDLIENYKYVNGKHFGERKHWLQDDYVKFLRYGEHFINKTGEGVLAYINNHSFLDNPTFKGMRWHLLESFDKIYIIDLHGNSKKKEVCPDGSKDENVFDITAGVSINIFVKTGKKKKGKLADVLHYDVWGKRLKKYQELWQGNLDSLQFTKVNYRSPYFFFQPKDYSDSNLYDKGFQINELMPINVTGIVTARDSVVIDIDKKELLKRINMFCDESISDNEIRQILFPNKKDGKYLAGDSRGWKMSEARKKIRLINHSQFVKNIAYRPFDNRKIYYSSDMVDWAREKYMKHFFKGENIGLALCRQFKTGNKYAHLFIANKIIESSYVSNRTSEITSLFPLYIYSDGETNGIFEDQNKKPNLNNEIVNQIANKLGLTFISEKEKSTNKFAPIDILDYIYAVLHSPAYRDKYKEFLKIDFPRVPYPTDKKTFWKLVKIGSQIRQIHLLESPKVEKYITTYPVDGDNTVTRRLTKNDWEITNEKKQLGRIWINDEQYFDKIPVTAWNFYIGGYQPAQKWLKDHRGRELSFEDIQHYQKIIVALTETDRLMKEVDKVGVEW